jgi:hypothetical protein
MRRERRQEQTFEKHFPTTAEQKEKIQKALI